VGFIYSSREKLWELVKGGEMLGGSREGVGGESGRQGGTYSSVKIRFSFGVACMARADVEDRRTERAEREEICDKIGVASRCGNKLIRVWKCEATRWSG